MAGPFGGRHARPSGPRRRRFRPTPAPAGGVRGRLHLAGWLVTLPVAGLAVARLSGFDRSGVVSAANAGTPFVYLPAYGGLLAGWLSRRRLLTAVAGAVVVCHLVWTAPELRPRRRLPPEAHGAPRVRVLSANVRFTSHRSTSLAKELATSGADVLCIQELSWRKLRELTAAGAFAAYPYSVVDPRTPGSFGGGIWSRHPLSEAETWSVAGLPQTRATVHVGEHELRLFNVHIKAPSRRRWVDLWTRQHQIVGDVAAAEKRPVVIAGDFNATYGHAPFRQLLGRGFRDAHVEAGRGLARSWPRGRLLPPVFRLDHVLVSSGLAVLNASEGRGRGSDHRPVIAELALVPDLSEASEGRRRRS